MPYIPTIGEEFKIKEIEGLEKYSAYKVVKVDKCMHRLLKGDPVYFYVNVHIEKA